MQIAFGHILSRLGPFTLCPDAEAPRYRPNILLHGLETLKLRFAA